jgi:hypothetical protein
MNNANFLNSISSIYPNLSTSNLAAISNISSNILEIAKHGNEKFSSLQNWSILDCLKSLPMGDTQNILVRGAGQSRYNPMKWEGAFNLKNALTSQISQYQKFPDRLKLGLLVTDIWRPVELYEFIGPIEQFERVGIISIPILVSGHLALPLKWPWR